MGPLANSRRPDAIEALVQDAKAKGARVLAGGERGDSGFFFQPTLLADVPNEAEIMNDEPFGPVAVSRPFDTFDEAIEQANRLPYGLAAFAFTENGRRANLIGDLVESGMVGINTFAISRRRRAVRRGEGFRLRQRRRQRRPGELPGGQGDPPGLTRHPRGSGSPAASYAARQRDSRFRGVTKDRLVALMTMTSDAPAAASLSTSLGSRAATAFSPCRARASSRCSTRSTTRRRSTPSSAGRRAGSPTWPTPTAR